MKRNLRFFAAAVATISLLASCAEEMKETTTPNDDSDVTTNVPSEGYVTITFKADYPSLTSEQTASPTPAEAATRTVIDDNGNVSWKIGDKIGLYYMEGNNPAFVAATALDEGASAEFQVSIPEGVTAVYAVYPADKGELSADGVFKVKTAATQDGAFEKVNYAAAWSEVTDEMNLKFKNVVGMFRVKLPEGGILKDGSVNHVIKSIGITGKKAELAFLGDVTVTVENGALSFSAPENGVGEAVIELNDQTRNAGYVYIPSLPVNSPDGLVFRFMNAEGKYLPAAVTKDDKAINLERGHLKPVNTACESVIFDWYFAANGQGDGKSADAAAGVELFQKLLNDSQYLYGERRLDGARLNLAEGTYSLTQQLNIQGVEAGNITITGAGLQATLIDGETLASQMVACASAKNLNLSKLMFQNAKAAANGAVLNTSGSSGKLICQNVGFCNNYTTKNSGAIYFGGTAGADFTDCLFEGNSTDKNVGGAVATGGSAAGTVTFKNTTFIKNTAGVNTGSSGGAIYHAAKDRLLVDNCLFDGNTASVGGGLYNNTSESVAYVTRSLFVGNVVTKTTSDDSGAAIYNNGLLGVYNCTFNYNHSKDKQSSTVKANVNYVIANSTFVESMKSTIGVVRNRATSLHTSTIVNSIVLTTGTNQTHCALSTWKATDEFNFLDCGYNLVTRIEEGFTAASDDATTYANAVKADFAFPNAVDKATKCYSWTGDITAFTGYSNCKLSDVERLIKANTALGTDFWNWLTTTKTSDGYTLAEVDVRGVKRNTEVMWPGSYQNLAVTE